MSLCLFLLALTLGNHRCGWQTCLLELPKEFHYARLSQWLSVKFLLDKMLAAASMAGLGSAYEAIFVLSQNCLSRNFSSKLKQTQYSVMEVLQIIHSFFF